MNSTRKWKTLQASLTGGSMSLGDRNELLELPTDAVISITHGTNMGLLQAIVNGFIINLFILPPLPRNEDLLYAELHGALKNGDSLTITVWRGKGMIRFRDESAHGWAKRLLTGFLFGQKVKIWFLTYTPKDRRIPTAEEARHLSEMYGKMFMNGHFVRSASRPAFSSEP